MPAAVATTQRSSRPALHLILIALLTALGFLAACAGPAGPQGPTGPTGDQGAPSDAGSGVPGATGATGSACDGLPAGATQGLHAAFTISAPANGQFFAAGEAPVITAKLTSDCGRAISLGDASLSTANLYVVGPRAPLLTKTANKLMNAVSDRTAPDRQHHFINLKAPHFADATQQNLSVAADGTITYKLAPVSSETPGTYTASLWLKANGDRDQAIPQANFQIGTATAEPLASGEPASSLCLDCHKGVQSGRVNMHHSEPSSFGPLGNFSLDSAPIGSCKACHNNDGYSQNPILRKVHAVHRGKHQKNAGVAHPDYNVAADTTLASFTNVGFPSFPDGEKDCTKCHVTDQWQKNPSRLACGSCHDNVFFDTGTLNPPRSFGVPAAGKCVKSSDCSSIGNFVTCDVPSGACVRVEHPIQTSDQQCSVCHTADATGISSITTRHAVYQRVAKPGIALSNVAITGGSGPNGTFLQNDRPVISFKLADNSGPIIDAVTSSSYSITAIVSGPTDDVQRVYAPITSRSTLVYTAASGVYAFTFPPWPANALPPVNVTDPSYPVRPNPSGSYSLFFYVVRSFTDPAGGAQRDVASWLETVKFGADGPVRPRQVVSQDACNKCHVQVQAHGGSRQVARACSACHTQGALDRAVGSVGNSCSATVPCAGALATPAWEQCQSGTCVMTADPTPGATIDFSQMIHNLHFARLREGFAERNNFTPGAFGLVGFRNSLNDFSEVLLPVDVRNCQQCHTDSGSSCKVATDCGVGQSCSAGKCVNTAWQNASARACLTCHDSSAAYAHAQVNTFTPAGGAPIESCEVCHGTDAGDRFSVKAMHDLSSTMTPAYPREKQ